MKKQQVLVMLAGFLFGVVSVFSVQAEQQLSVGGLNIKVTDTQKKAGQYRVFQVEIQNNSGADRKIEGKIELFSQSPAAVADPAPLRVASCVVFKKIPAGRTISETAYCKYSGSYSSWKFSAVRLYNEKGRAIPITGGASDTPPPPGGGAEANSPDGAKSQVRNGVRISVSKMADSQRGYRRFKITAKNESGAARSLSMKIFLIDNRVKGSDGGRCTVFMKLPAGAARTEEKQCKQTGRANSWIARIVKVYNF